MLVLLLLFLFGSMGPETATTVADRSLVFTFTLEDVELLFILLLLLLLCILMRVLVLLFLFVDAFVKTPFVVAVVGPVIKLDWEVGGGEKLGGTGA